MSLAVVVHGSGVAACACVRLLQQQKLQPSFQFEQRSHGPTVLINGATQWLLRDIFGIDESFFAGLHRIHRRVVRWGPADKLDLAHDGFVIPEWLLLEKLWRITESSATKDRRADFHIYSARRTDDVNRLTFGSRSAQVTGVEIQPGASDACWVESLPDGWLFLLPDGTRTGSLLAVGGETERMLEESTLIAQQISSTTEGMPSLAVSPRIVIPLCASDWLACGTAAMAFDPICGEGVGNALRGALLACACLTNSDPRSALAEYAPRLLLGFLKHLEVGRGFYSGVHGEWWSRELAHLERGIEWTRVQMSHHSAPRYRMAHSGLSLT